MSNRYTIEIIIHRHTGGLEKKIGLWLNAPKIHRHTGGLESQNEQ